MVAELIKEKYNIKEKEHFISTRKGILNLAKLSLEERNALIKNQPTEISSAAVKW